MSNDVTGTPSPSQSEAATTPYATAHAAGKAALRRLLLDTASTLLEREGPDALTMRRIASEAGCSTTVLYTMFGGKTGIAEDLWREGFERLTATLDAATGSDPLERLAAIGRAYRDNALANRSYYAVMFQRPIPGFEPSPEAYEASRQSLRTLADAVADCIRAGIFRAEDPKHIAGVLWAATHGAVSLELAGYEGAVDAERRFDDLSAAAAAWFMTANRPSAE
ncbi:MAG TPA: TetR/AcrR family transcriptional regulator [Jiangellaceae bacterium]|jgi:AcrR family transcriptional regulator|nr:TetR/AcrR family transcriptional regulator [Jiangellaceae bacterium]